jgi:hypothetical protein
MVKGFYDYLVPYLEPYEQRIKALEATLFKVQS